MSLALFRYLRRSPVATNVKRLDVPSAAVRFDDGHNGAAIFIAVKNPAATGRQIHYRNIETGYPATRQVW